MVNLNYMGIKPIRNQHGDILGTHLQQVQSINPNGSLPEWYKKKKAVKQGKDGILSMIAYLQEQDRAISNSNTVLSDANSDVQS